MKLSTSIRSLFLTLTLVGLVFGLQACGGGGGGSDTPAPITTDQDASGIYTGTGTINSVSTGDFKAIIFNNRFMIFSITEKVLYDGNITNINLTDMTATADVYIDGIKTQTGVGVTATVTTESQIQSFTISGTGKGEALFDLTYDSVYKTEVATEDRANSTYPNPFWVGNLYNLISNQTTTDLEQFNGGGTPTYSLYSTSTGVQCGYEGAIATNVVNVYDVTMIRVTSSDTACTVDTSASYTGLATVLTTSSTDDTLWYIVTNGVHSVFGVLTQ